MKLEVLEMKMCVHVRACVHAATQVAILDRF